MTHLIVSVAAQVRRRPGSVLIGQGMAATLIACLAARCPDLDIGAALLVAPADPERPRAGWRGPAAQLPLDPLPFPSVLIARRGGRAMALRRARLVARAWESAFVVAGPSGSANTRQDGLRLLDRLAGMRDLARLPGRAAALQASPPPEHRRARCA